MLKPMIRLCALAAPALLLCGGVALAAEAGGVENPWLELLYKAINFFVLVGILVFFLRKPAGAFFRGAAQQDKDSMAQSRETEAAAARDMTEQKAKIEQMQSELARMLTDSRADAAAELTRMTEEAHTLAERMKLQVQQQLEQEMRKARLELRNELAADTLRLAEERVKQRIGPDDQSRLISDYTNQLGS